MDKYRVIREYPPKRVIDMFVPPVTVVYESGQEPTVGDEILMASELRPGQCLSFQERRTIGRIALPFAWRTERFLTYSESQYTPKVEHDSYS